MVGVEAATTLSNNPPTHTMLTAPTPHTAAEVGVEAATTPDSGVHENMAGLSPEEQHLQAAEWEAELAKVRLGLESRASRYPHRRFFTLDTRQTAGHQWVQPRYTSLSGRPPVGTVTVQIT